MYVHMKPRFRRKDMGAEDPTEFQSMMQLITELLPLLTESWVEVQPAPGRLRGANWLPD